MKAGARVALAVGAGYALGRTKKMRLALMIAAAGATGRANLSPAKLLETGLSRLGSSPELSKLTDIARDELMSAAKAAAVTAATSRIESLSDRLQEGGPLRAPKQDSDDTDDTGDTRDTDDTDEEYAEVVPEETQADTDTDTDADEEKPPPRRKTARSGGRRRSATRSGGNSAESGNDSGRDDSADESDEQPARVRRSRASTGRAPVRRARR